MAYETFEQFLDATRSSRPRPKMVDAWLAGRDSVREYYAPAFEAMTETLAHAERAEAALAALQTPCVWTRADDGWFETGCNVAPYSFRAPKFCPRCGHRVEVAEGQP